MKRLFDLLASAMGLLLLAVPLALLAWQVRRKLGSPVLFTQVRPGITGWAQVNGRNAISWADKFALDVWYVDHRSLWLDVCILWLTVRKVLVRDGNITDSTLAARMGQRGRQLAEDKYDVHKVNAVMLKEMGLGSACPVLCRQVRAENGH